MPSIKEMRKVCQQRRPNAKGKMVWAGHWFNRLVTRWFSIYITWLCVKFNLSANSVTFLMIVSGLAGFALCVPHVLWINIVGAILLLLGEFLDCVDGEVARWNKKSSLKGKYLDLVYHVLCNAPVSCICALHVYAMKGQAVYLVLAFLAYAMAQIRLGLREEFLRIASEIVERAATDQGAKHRTPPGRHRRRIRSLSVAAVKWLLHKSVDGYIARFAVISAMLLAYAGMLLPLIVLSWWFVVLGGIHNIGDVLHKYYVLIPDAGHEKKV